MSQNEATTSSVQYVVKMYDWQSDTHRLWGPFPTKADAEAWAEGNYSETLDNTWTIRTLTPAEDFGRRAAKSAHLRGVDPEGQVDVGIPPHSGRGSDQGGES